MAQQERRRILFVGGVPPQITEQTLSQHFSRFSELTNVRIKRDKQTRESKGYAYITVADYPSISHILETEHFILGRKLDVQLASSKSEKHEWKILQRYRRVYAVGLPPGTTNDQVVDAFQQFGIIRNAFIIRTDESRIGREYAYIQFADDRAAELALSSVIKINGKVIGCQPFGTRRRHKNSYQQNLNPKPVVCQAQCFGGILGSQRRQNPVHLGIPEKNRRPVLDFARKRQSTNISTAKLFSKRLTYDSPSNYRFNLVVPRTIISRMH